MSETLPEITVTVARKVPFRTISEPGDAVVAVVNGLAFVVRPGGEELPLLSHHQEEHPIDEVEELSVVAGLV